MKVLVTGVAGFIGSHVATKFLENGDKVKITLRFRGREMAHQELGAELMERVAIDTAHLGKPDVIPKVEGRQMVMIIYPNT